MIVKLVFNNLSRAKCTISQAGNLEPSVLSEFFSSLWNKHLVSAANLVIVHAEQYRYERQLARACLRRYMCILCGVER
jgi:hypothetical protein